MPSSPVSRKTNPPTTQRAGPCAPLARSSSEYCGADDFVLRGDQRIGRAVGILLVEFVAVGRSTSK